MNIRKSCEAVLKELQIGGELIVISQQHNSEIPLVPLREKGRKIHNEDMKILNFARKPSKYLAKLAPPLYIQDILQRKIE